LAAESCVLGANEVRKGFTICQALDRMNRGEEFAMLMKKDKPFQLPSGITINKHSLKEGYNCEPCGEDAWKITINLSAEKMAEVLSRLFDALEYPGFLILETPASNQQEKDLVLVGEDGLHQNVYYWDGLSKEAAQAVYEENRELLVNDGLSSFGFGSHFGKEEVFVGRYKTIYIWTKTPEKYMFLLGGMDLKQHPVLFTLGDYIHSKNSCDLYSIQVNGMTVYDLIDRMLPKGLYLAKTTEE
jgi:hypothetical protein